MSFYALTLLDASLSSFKLSHSPILLGFPDAQILSFDDGAVHPCNYEDTDSYQITSLFLNNREQLLSRLLKNTEE